MNSVKLGALIVLLVVGQGVAQTSYMNFQLALGGDNQAAAWENPTDCSNFPTFIPGSTTPLQSYPPNSIITWDVRVIAGGNHTTERGTYATAGAANVVFNLELRVGSDTGPLADFPASDALGAARGWFSSINNGDPGGGGTRHTVCGQPADPEKKAAFAVSFQVAAEAGNPHYGRAIDITATGGPNLGYALYPSASAFPTGSTALSGTLMGMGCGYKGFRSSGCPGNSSYCHYTGVDSEKWSSAGVGLSSGSTLCNRYLGIVPVFEGQMNTGGLPAGTYVLRLVPGSGCNLMDGGISCDTHDVDAGKFAYKPDVALTPVSISFVLEAPVSASVAGRHLFYNGSAFGGSIATDKSALLAGQAEPNNKGSFANVCTHSRGINGIYIDIENRNRSLTPTAADFTFKVGNNNTVASWPTLSLGAGNPTVTVANDVPVAGTDRIKLVFTNNSVPDMKWLQVTVVSGSAGIGDLAGGNDVFYFGSLIGECGLANQAGYAIVTSADYQGAYNGRTPPNPSPVSITNVYDFDKSKYVLSADYQMSYADRNHMLNWVTVP